MIIKELMWNVAIGRYRITYIIWMIIKELVWNVIIISRKLLQKNMHHWRNNIMI